MDDAFKTKRDAFANFSTAKEANAKKDANKKDSKSDNEDDLELGEEASTHSAKNGKPEEKKEIVVHDCFPVCCTNRYVVTVFRNQHAS